MRDWGRAIAESERLAAGFALVLRLSVIATSYALYSARVNAEVTREMMQKPLAMERLVSDWHVLIRPSRAPR